MNDAIISTVGQLLTLLGLPFTEVTTAVDGDVTRVSIASPTPSRIIGWHGETLNAVQHLAKSILRSQQKLQKAPFLVLDTDGYRLMQEDKVRRIAEAKADFVRRTGARVTLPPMSPYFRRIVHTHVASKPELADLATESVGEGEYRQVVIRLKDQSTAVSSESSEELSPVMADESGLENLDV